MNSIEINNNTMLSLSIISIVTCCFAALSFVIFPAIRNKESFSILIWLFVSNILNNLGSAFGVPADRSPACWFEGIATNLFTLSAVSWSTVITFSMFHIVNTSRLPVIDWRYHVFCWGLPALATFLPLMNTRYGAPNGIGWCWVVPTSSSPSWALPVWYWFSFYFWALLGFVTMVYFYVRMRIKIRSFDRTYQASVIKTVDSVKYYPAIILVCWFLTSLYDFGLIANETYQTVELGISCLQGFFTSLLFFYTNGDARSAWYHLWLTGKFIESSGNHSSNRRAEVSSAVARLQRGSHVSLLSIPATPPSFLHVVRERILSYGSARIYTSDPPSSGLSVDAKLFEMENGYGQMSSFTLERSGWVADGGLDATTIPTEAGIDDVHSFGEMEGKKDEDRPRTTGEDCEAKKSPRCFERQAETRSGSQESKGAEGAAVKVKVKPPPQNAEHRFIDPSMAVEEIE